MNIQDVRIVQNLDANILNINGMGVKIIELKKYLKVTIVSGY